MADDKKGAAAEMTDGEDQPQPEAPKEEQPVGRIDGPGFLIRFQPGTVDMSVQIVGVPNTPQIVAAAAWLDALAKMRLQSEIAQQLQRANERAPFLVPNGHAKMPPPPGMGPRPLR